MLKERVLTALVLVAVLLGVMLGLPPIATVWLLTVLVLVGAWEWAGFAGHEQPAAARGVHDRRCAGAGRVPLLLYRVAGLRADHADGRHGVVVRGVPVALPGAGARDIRSPQRSAGLLSLVPCWLALVYVTFTTQSTHWVLFTLALVWAADTGAFFAGRWLGRVPLAPRVSPKKTWEGAIGGVLASAIVAWAGRDLVAARGRLAFRLHLHRRRGAVHRRAISPRAC